MVVLQGRTELDALWYELSEKDKTLTILEARIEAMEAAAGSRPRADPASAPGAEDIRSMVQARVDESLEEIWMNIQEIEVWSWDQG